MIDVVAAVSRAAAAQLAREYGSKVALDVEAALSVRNARSRPETYIDFVSIGSLIVSAATLAWTIYSDQRKENPEREADALRRAVRDSLGAAANGDFTLQERITTIVVAEIVQTGSDGNPGSRWK
jgi:hypothetical protein